MPVLPIKRPRVMLSITVSSLRIADVGHGRSCRGKDQWQYEERELPLGLVRPSATTPNITDVTALTGHIRSLREQRRSLAAGGPIALSLPDLCARTTLFDFEAWPQKATECEALVRFRFQKDLNLPTGDARIVYRAFRQATRFDEASTKPASPVTRVLAVAVRQDILGQYEQACLDAGLIPAEITLTSLQAVDRSTSFIRSVLKSSTDDFFFLHITEGAFSFFAFRDGYPTFVRIKPLRHGLTLSSPPDSSSPPFSSSSDLIDQTLAQELLATLQFYDEVVPPVHTGAAQAPRLLVVVGIPPQSRVLAPGTAEQMQVQVIVQEEAEVGQAIEKDRGWSGTRGLFKGRSRLPYLHLSLTQPGLGFARAAQWTMAVTIAVCISIAALLWWNSEQLTEQAVQYERAAQRVQEMNQQFVKQAALIGIDLTEGRATAIGREVAFANRLLETRAFSWTRFLSDLEEAVPPNISISSVALDFKDTIITLNGTALTLKDVMTLVNGLENHRAFRNVILSQHKSNEASVRDDLKGPMKAKAKTVDFTMTVAYRPPS